MKQTLQLFTVALFTGALTLGGYKYFEESPKNKFLQTEQKINYTPVNFSGTNASAMETDFTIAAEKTVHAVVHVKNKTISKQPTNIAEYFQGGGQPREMIGSGSGVIISPDGYIITNNHVIANATELQVTLNDNRTYSAVLIGTDPKTDIALIKIESKEEFPFVAFGDSNDVKLGEWVLAVGNPFNLTSTVTAGIISAKARDLNKFDNNPQSFIQTDAAVNRGNSGGALVNTRGELIGINTAITSETGSYVGYSFAVPSNNARKVIEDIMEYGNVQRGILGIQGANINPQIMQQEGVIESEGVYVAGIEPGSGADKAGLRKGDIIQEIDGYKVRKFTDLIGYIGSKRPNDIVNVKVIRNKNEKSIPVKLFKLETLEIDELGIEVKNASPSTLKERGVTNGIEIYKSLTDDRVQQSLVGSLITEINDKKINDIDDVRSIFSSQNPKEQIKITFVSPNGQINTYIYR